MTSRGWADLYAWQLDRASRTPLTRQIYMQVRSAVLSGALCPGTRVPSSRAMASKLGVARAPVVLAYEQLLAEGYVESRQGSGTFISGDLTGLASRRRGAPRAIKCAVPTSAQVFPDFERSAVQSDARPFNTGRTHGVSYLVMPRLECRPTSSPRETLQAVIKGVQTDGIQMAAA
jgi:GntR family transcriptional regulator / MocR family aminotransferase